MTGGVLRLSVRALVAFSVFPPDILPLSARAMELGRQGHLARQAESEARAETPLFWEGEVLGRVVRVSGRMDLYSLEDGLPLIEEIKLSPQKAPEAPLEEHLLQAACYGFMLCEKDAHPAVRLQVSYVTPEGRETAVFSEDWGFERLRASFFGLLEPCVAWQQQLDAHISARDLSIARLPFPYPDYRPGQREMAEQVYTAIQRKRRLFAVMPTGTGKTAAVLYPALKALGQGLALKIFCLTARGTQRLAMQKEIDRMLALGLVIHALTLNSKESLCPMEQLRCHPDHCERAKGHYERQPQALNEAMRVSVWDTDYVLMAAGKHQLCPFEFSLALSELADVVICDYNYALDPQVRLTRIFDNMRKITLLADEAHNLPDRARDMLSGSLTVRHLSDFRREAGRAHGRTSPLYKACTALMKLMAQDEADLDAESFLGGIDSLLSALGEGFTPGGMHLIRDLVSLKGALLRAGENSGDYFILRQPGKERGQLAVLNLNPAPHLMEVTGRLSGVVFYSATLEPLSAMRTLLGGEREDACLSLPSPFPVEHLLCLHYPVNTRFKARDASLEPVARAILSLFSACPGKMIAYFPSFAYLRAVLPLLLSFLPGLPTVVQEGGMDEQARLRFLSAFTGDEHPVLGLCVLGGVFAEGVDLPGEALTAVAVVGVGLPQVNAERDLFKARMEEAMGDGFGFAYRYPGMHKVLQAAGRLIRSENDRGVLLLLDDRYAFSDYSELLPAHVMPERVHSIEEITLRTKDFFLDAGRDASDG